MVLGGELHFVQIDAKKSNFEMFYSAGPVKSGSMPLTMHILKKSDILITFLQYWESL